MEPEDIMIRTRAQIEIEAAELKLQIEIEAAELKLQIKCFQVSLETLREEWRSAPVKLAPSPVIVHDPFVAPSEIEVGMYRDGDRIIRVYPARSGGHLLAKELHLEENGSWRFEYLGAAKRFVGNAKRMTLEDAKEWGSNFGTCCVCAALLTDPTSVAAGVGPVCGSRV